ncbi:hypothetical protein KQX54_008443 [Cotesia glomerata]|uniref:Uncharacterized protein n=1 Tax=Cotesia glomerata TaxID=32391 RepID=A0AAV7IGZ0_COTGL|nr:hypothetical protein KQX54_008443 [Cotesia glomerata]
MKRKRKKRFDLVKKYLADHYRSHMCPEPLTRPLQRLMCSVGRDFSRRSREREEDCDIDRGKGFREPLVAWYVLAPAIIMYAINKNVVGVKRFVLFCFCYLSFSCPLFPSDLYLWWSSVATS